MLRPNRAFLSVVIFVLFVTALPLPATTAVRSSVISTLETPITFFKEGAQFFIDLARFRHNAVENRALQKKLAGVRLKKFYSEELYQENARLTKLLNFQQTLPPSVGRRIACRVIGKSALAWNGTYFLDKGTREGLHTNMLVLADNCLIGKLIEVGPSVSKVLLVTDPNFKAGVIVQRTRQQGILFGTPSGECHVKYLSVETPLRAGDAVETAGFSGYFPKALLIGSVERSWKEPGQIYQVAALKLAADLSRVEEVIVVD